MNPEDYRYHVEKLPNGLRLAWLNVPHARTVHLTAIVRGGCLYETKENNGVSHLLEHLHMATSKKYPTRKAMTEAIGRMGHANAMTTPENIHFELGTVHERLEIATELIAEILIRRQFACDDIELEKALIVDEIRSAGHEWSGDPMTRFLFETSGSLASSGGTRRSLERLDSQRITDFDTAAFRPENIVVGAAGKLDAVSVQRVTSVLSKWNVDGIERLAPNSQTLRRLPAVGSIPSIAGSNGVFIGFVISDAPRGADWVSMGYLDTGLFSPPSRLFEELRYGKANVYNVGCNLTRIVAGNLLFVQADARPRERRVVADEVLGTLRQIKENGIDGHWFEAMRDQAQYWLFSVINDAGWLSGRIAQAEFYFSDGRGEDLVEEVDAVLNLTRDQFQDFARRLFRPENCFILLGSKSWRCAPRHFRGMIEKYLG
ncbi:MAG: insulinase family protein [Phycisphaerae bacterium]|nr:insulinase family protein [Phycisphaerae bacterium]